MEGFQFPYFSYPITSFVPVYRFLGKGHDAGKQQKIREAGKAEMID